MTLSFEPSNAVRDTIQDGVLRVTVDRPEKRNALSLGVLRRVEELFTQHREEGSIRLAIVSGAGDRAFASGGDLVELASVRSPDEARALSRHGKAALNAIRRFPVAVLARVNGLALGGGAELALACDVRFAAAHATIGFIHSRLNITPSWGGGVDLMRLTGYATGMRLLARGDILSAAEALAAGLFDAVAPAGADFDEAFESYIAGMRRQSPQVMRAIKALAIGERMQDRERLDEIETDHFAATWSHDDHWTAVAAMGKRSKAK